MLEWTPEAETYLDGYLHQVTALLRAESRDAADVLDDMREHIVRESEASAAGVVSLDDLRRVLARFGTPETVVAYAGPEKKQGSSAQESAGAGPGKSPARSRPALPSLLLAIGIGAVVTALFMLALSRGAGLREAVGTGASSSQVAGDWTYTLETVQKQDVAHFVQRLSRPDDAYHPFSAMWALIIKADRASDAERANILDQVLSIVADHSMSFQPRYQCCYVASAFEYEPAIPVLENVLLNDSDQDLREVAACALGHFESPRARQSLLRAKETETNGETMGWIVRALEGKFPRPKVPTPGTRPA